MNMNERDWGIARVLAALVLAALFVFLVAEAKDSLTGDDENPANRNTIAVTADARQIVKPEIGYVSFGVRKESTSATTARTQADEASKAVVDYLKGQGIEEKDIRTTGYNMYNQDKYTPVVCSSGVPCPPTSTSQVFVVDVRYEVKIRNLDKAGQIVSGVTGAGANQVDSLRFGVDEPRIQELRETARKQTLIDYGFRLPSALDNRPLTFNEFESKLGQTIFVSATPSEYEYARGNIAEQLIRPTGLLDPTIEVRKATNQVKETEEEIVRRTKDGERTLVVTLTKRMAEDISEYLSETGLKIAWLHSDIKTLERTEILRSLRTGEVDAIIGINLLREGLDLPEVSLICILDADKEGFLRNTTTLIQTIGRASRNPKGHVIMFADKVTESMQRAIDETARRRAYQESYNRDHGITPTALRKEIRESLFPSNKKMNKDAILAELKKDKRSALELKKEIEAEMLKEASLLNFERAAELRDILKSLE